jgi:sigma-E factor negative regulatory protein RseC
MILIICIIIQDQYDIYMERSGLETGTVIEINGDRARVRINKSKSCKECGKARAGICGKSGEGMVMEVRNSLNAEQGNTVTISLETKAHAAAYFVVFILPVLSLFIFAYLGHEISGLTGIKGMDVILGMTGLIVCIGFSLLKLKKMDSSAEMLITRIVGE